MCPIPETKILPHRGRGPRSGEGGAEQFSNNLEYPPSPAAPVLPPRGDFALVLLIPEVQNIHIDTSMQKARSKMIHGKKIQIHDGRKGK